MASSRRRGSPAAEPQPIPAGFVSEDTLREMMARMQATAQGSARELEVTLQGVVQSNEITNRGAAQQHSLNADLSTRYLTLLDDYRKLGDELAMYKRQVADIEDRKSQREAALAEKKAELEATQKKLSDLMTFVQPLLVGAKDLAGAIVAAKFGLGGMPGAPGGMPPGAAPGLGPGPGPGPVGPRQSEPSAYTAPPASLEHIEPWRLTVIEILRGLSPEGCAELRCVFAEALSTLSPSSPARERLGPHLESVGQQTLQAFLIYTAAARANPSAQAAA